MILKECLNCHVDFIPKDRRSNFCSDKCRHEKTGKRKSQHPKKCKICGDDFFPYYRLQKFCSSKCRILNMKATRSFNWNSASVKKRTGKSNPCYRTGMYQLTTKRNSQGLKQFSRNASEIERSMIDVTGYIYCERCGTSNPLKFERHHVIFRSEKPGHKNLHDKINILITCISCHNLFHKEKSLRNEIVVVRGLNELFGNDVLDKR